MDTVIFNILHYIFLVICLLGIAFLVLGIIKIFAKTIFIKLRRLTNRKTTKKWEAPRRQLSSSLLLDLEVMIVGDTIGTIIHPTLQEVAVLSSLAAVRTVISFFLSRETKKTQV